MGAAGGGASLGSSVFFVDRGPGDSGGAFGSAATLFIGIFNVFGHPLLFGRVIFFAPLSHEHLLCDLWTEEFAKGVPWQNAPLIGSRI